jgi:hypothetical protein
MRKENFLVSSFIHSMPFFVLLVPLVLLVLLVDP